MATISAERIKEIEADFGLLLDYVFGDIKEDEEKEVDRAIAQSKTLASYVEDLLFIALKQELSKGELRQIFVRSKMVFTSWLSGNI